jgi:virginiamycin A acetyltransferase
MPPDPAARHPIPAAPRLAFLRAVVDHPQIEIGEYSYYDDPDGPERFVERCVPYLFDFIGDRLVIGRFVMIATGVRFIMNGGNHGQAGFSTYPFGAFPGWQAAPPPMGVNRGDTVIGHDVWIGRGAMILPGTRVGHGAIIGAGAVVGGEVAPYAVVAGNPARELRRRFDAATVEELIGIAWWDWPAERIERNIAAILGQDLARLRAAA